MATVIRIANPKSTAPKCGACHFPKTEIIIPKRAWQLTCTEEPPGEPGDDVVVGYFCYGPCPRALKMTHRRYGYKSPDVPNVDYADEQ